MQHRKLILGTAVLTALASTVALAGRGPGDGPRDMAFADTNGDGTVTVEEMQARHAERFQAADADGNGKLSVDEMQNAMLRQRAQHRVQALDTDGDGNVSAEEYQAPMRWRLSRMDHDGDGQIGPREMRRERHERWDDDDDDRRHGGYRDED